MRQNILTGVFALAFAVFAFVPAASAQNNSGNNNAGGGNVPCSEYGLELIAKYDTEDSEFVFKEGDNVVTFSDIETDEDGEITAAKFSLNNDDKLVSAIIVKGAVDSKKIPKNGVFDPAVSSGSFDNSGLKTPNDKNTPAISNVQFCAGDADDNGGNGGQNGGVTNGTQDEVGEVEENGQVLSDQIDAPVSGEGVDAGGGAVVGAVAGLFASLSGLGYGIRRFVKSE